MDLQELTAQALSLIPEPEPRPSLLKTPEPLRYASTPWSERTTSSSLTSVTSRTASPSVLSSIEVALPSDIQQYRLSSESDKITLLHTAYRFKDLYGRITMGKFWNMVAKEVSKLTGYPPRKNLSRNVTAMVKARRDFLETLESGEQDPQSSYTEAIDAWIGVVDAYQDMKNAEADAQGQLNSETQASTQWRLNQFLTFSDKTTLAISNRGKKRQRNQEEDKDEDNQDQDQDQDQDNNNGEEEAIPRL